MATNNPENTAPVARRAWVRTLVFGVVILLCGVVIGGVATAVALRHFPVHGMMRPLHPLPERIASDMQHKYNLTDEQKERLRVIFDEHTKKLSVIRAEVQPRVEAEHEALRRGVETVLTPEQAEQWRAEYERMRSLWHSTGNKQ